MADDFHLERFLPYLLNQAAEAASRGFARVYRDGYGMQRADWRVLAHLGQFGPLTASDICTRAHEEKTRVSRAVARLDSMGLLRRAPSDKDRRYEVLSLTDQGRAAYDSLSAQAARFDRALDDRLGPGVSAGLRQALAEISD